MKKVFMAALALTMAVFVSCSKDDFNVENNDVKEIGLIVPERISPPMMESTDDSYLLPPRAQPINGTSTFV